MKSLLCVVFLVLIIAEVLQADDDFSICDHQPSDFCRWDFNNAVDDMNTLLPSTAFLEKHCKEIQKSVQCMIDYEETCPGGRRGSRMDDILRFIQDVCNKKSDIGKIYHENVDCYNTVDSQIKECAQDVSNQTSRYRNFLARETGIMNEAVHSHIDCVMAFLLDNCLTDVITIICGDPAAAGAQELLTRLDGKESRDKCSSEDQRRYEKFAGSSVGIDIMID